MTITFANEYSALSPFVALIQQIVDGTIAESGVGANSFATLADKTTVNLPTLNSPLAVALAALAPKSVADAHYANAGNPHSVTPGQIGAQTTLVSGTNIKTIAGVSLLGTGDIPAVAGATAYTGLSDKASIDLPTVNTPLAAALATKVPILGSISLGTGAIALTATAHANHPTSWTGTSPQTVTIDTTGGTIDDIYEVANQGTADITMPGTAGAGYGLIIVPNTIGSVQWRGGSTFLSWIPSTASAPAPINDLTTGGSTSYASAQQLVVLKGLIDAVSGSAPPVAVTGSTVNGSVLTRTLATHWAETGGNWTRDGTNIAGATSATYTTVSADGTHTVTWKSASIPYIPTGIAVAAVVVVGNPASDNYDRTSTTGLGTSSGGNTWATGVNGVFGTDGDKAYVYSSTNNNKYDVIETSSAVQDISENIIFDTASPGLILRFTDDSNYWFVLLENTTTLSLYIKIGGGVYPQTTVTTTFVAGTSYLVRATVDSSHNYKVYIDGTLKLSWGPDSQIPTGTKAGIFVAGNGVGSAIRFNNQVVA